MVMAMAAMTSQWHDGVDDDDDDDDGVDGVDDADVGADDVAASGVMMMLLVWMMMMMMLLVWTMMMRDETRQDRQTNIPLGLCPLSLVLYIPSHPTQCQLTPSHQRAGYDVTFPY
jgi:hypothetical protein